MYTIGQWTWCIQKTPQKQLLHVVSTDWDILVVATITTLRLCYDLLVHYVKQDKTVHYGPYIILIIGYKAYVSLNKWSLADNLAYTGQC